MSAKRGLGRGFDSLIPTDLLDESFDPTAGQDQQISELRNILLSEISPDPNQPRRVFDEEALEELTASVREHGVVQPIIVAPNPEKGYTIVAGERRYRAAVAAGSKKIPALVRTLSAQHKLELSLIENLQRRDLSAIETATAYAKLRDQFNLPLEEIGQRVGGRSASTISNTMRLLQLPKIAQKAIADGQLTEGQARPLIKLKESQIEAILPQIIDEGWSARRIEEVAANLKRSPESLDKPTKPKADNKRYESAAGEISKYLAAPVNISVGNKGKGRVTIAFKNDDDLQRILKVLQK